MKHLVILQKWGNEKQETICLEYEMVKKDECGRMFEALRKDAYKRKFDVTYRLIELDGEMQYAGKEMVDFRKKNNIDRIIIANGKVYNDIPLYIEKELKNK